MRKSTGKTQSSAARTILVVGATLLAVDAAAAQDSAEMPAATQVPQVESSIGVVATNQYFFRGILQENTGAIVQPSADFVFPLSEGENTSWSFSMGTWSSLHDGPTGSGGAEASIYYELDAYAGIGVDFAENWSGSVSYIAYTSPNSSFSTLHEFDFSASFDDSGLFGGDSGGFSGLQPSVLVAWELAGQADGGGRLGDEGIYLQVGIEPAFDLVEGEILSVSASFPVVTGLSLSDYYEGATGNDDFFGFAQADVSLSITLNFVPARLGSWTLSGGVGILALGDNLATINGGDSSEVILSLGLGIAF